MAELFELAIDDVFGGFYRVERKLKSGGMGAVYIAQHTETGRRHALKLMHPEIVASPDKRARFKQEAQISSIIDYPSHIVEVTHAGVDAATGAPFIVMELLIGQELGELLASQGALSPAEAIDYLSQTARALDRAHARGVVHRDLKPDNLFVVLRDDEPATVKILDFGIAKILQGSAVTQSTNAGGTPLYMAPEQTGKSSSIGPHTDVWALGLIAYTMLVGEPYWEPETIQQLFGEILGGEYERPSVRAARKGKSLSPGFDDWFLKCVCRDTTTRIAKAGEAIAALAEALGVAYTAPTTTGRASLASRTASASGAATAPATSAAQLVEMEHVGHATANVADVREKAAVLEPRAAAPAGATKVSGAAGTPAAAASSALSFDKTDAAPIPISSMNSSVNAREAPSATADPVVVAVSAKRAPVIPIVAGVLAVALLGGAIWMVSKSAGSQKGATTAAAPASSSAAEPIAAASAVAAESDSVGLARDRIQQAGWKITAETPSPASAGCAHLKFTVEKGDDSGDVDHYDCDDAAAAQAKAAALASTNAKTKNDVVIMVSVANVDAASELIDAILQ